jgi:hypothetical protein
MRSPYSRISSALVASPGGFDRIAVLMLILIPGSIGPAAAM